MQDYSGYAEKNGVILQESGPCQFCGANLAEGIKDCLMKLGEISNVIDFSKPENNQARFLAVDAHALQHPEIHGRWNNHIHLLRLELIFQQNIYWTYKHTPQLSNFINEYKKDNSNYLIPPPVCQRGLLTTSQLSKIKETEELKIAIRKWAGQVFDAYSKHHLWAEKMALKFLGSPFFWSLKHT